MVPTRWNLFYPLMALTKHDYYLTATISKVPLGEFLLLNAAPHPENTTVGAQIKLDSDVRCFLDWSTEM